jgi:hypothetical protein
MSISESDIFTSTDKIIEYYVRNKIRIISSDSIQFNNLSIDTVYIFKEKYNTGSFNEFIIIIKNITPFYITIIKLFKKNELSDIFEDIFNPKTVNINSNIARKMLDELNYMFLLIANNRDILFQPNISNISNVQNIINTKITPTNLEEVKNNHDYRDEITCKICFINKVNIVYIPCGHLYCSDCDKQKTKNECPLCRVKIISKQTIFI